VAGGPAPAGPDSWATPELSGGPALGGPDDDLDASSGPWWRDELPGRGKEGRGVGPQRRSRWLMLLGLAAVVVAGAIAVVVLHPFGHNGTVAGAAGTTPHAGSPSPSATGASSPALSEQQAARNLAALLAHSVADRSSVVNAVADVSRCGPRLSQDPRVFRDAAASRQRLLARLGSLPGRSTLPAPLLQSLTSAWQASAAADRDYARWARDESSGRCTRHYQADPGYRAAIGPDSRATTAKKAFASRWDAIAAHYSLHSFQWDQL
jgi:hypothetical protein